MGSVKPFKDINKISEEQSQDSLATMYIDHTMIVFDLGEEPKSDFSINHGISKNAPGGATKISFRKKEYQKVVGQLMQKIKSHHLSLMRPCSPRN